MEQDGRRPGFHECTRGVNKRDEDEQVQRGRKMLLFAVQDAGAVRSST